jgi:hypothetical protein
MCWGRIEKFGARGYDKLGDTVSDIIADREANVGHVETVVSNVFFILSFWLSHCFQSRIIALLASVISV